jgi:predicted transcriptional regulator
MKALKDIKRELLATPAVKAAYDEQAAEYNVARELIAARARAGLTQGDVAARMGTTQSVIARLEGGRQTPSWRTLQRYAQALGMQAVVRLEGARA